MHWADVIAKDIASKCDKPLIATGISPSGEIHVGSLREAITGESVRSALEALGKDVKLIYLVDDFDPLRKRYEFLPEEYEKYVNMPLSDIPCPCGKHKSYAHHYVEPFINAMKACDVRCEVIFVNEMYRKGMFAESIDKAFKRREKAMEILNKITGREMKPDWAPFNPLCEKCGRFTDPILDSYEYPYVEYQCKCGHHGKADITKGEGKLPWRLEWPAKWKIFNTSVEPFGKDHAAAGGSYDSGEVIVKEIFDGEPVYPIPYEFVQFKSKGQVMQMHKSKGNVINPMDLVAKYGDKLIATHLNDNLGIKDENGRIFWHDDLHLLPYDGMADWKEFAHRLNKCGYDDILTFELNNKSKPNRHENDKDWNMPIEEYIAECYVRACRFANALMKKANNSL